MSEPKRVGFVAFYIAPNLPKAPYIISTSEHDGLYCHLILHAIFLEPSCRAFVSARRFKRFILA
jgi:hypothetical protein